MIRIAFVALLCAASVASAEPRSRMRDRAGGGASSVVWAADWSSCGTYASGDPVRKGAPVTVSRSGTQSCTCNPGGAQTAPTDSLCVTERGAMTNSGRIYLPAIPFDGSGDWTVSFNATSDVAWESSPLMTLRQPSAVLGTTSLAQTVFASMLASRAGYRSSTSMTRASESTTRMAQGRSRQSPGA